MNPTEDGNALPVDQKSNLKSAAAIFIIVLIIGAVVSSVIFLRTTELVEARDQPSLVPPPPEVDLRAIADLLPPDSIQSIDEPQFETISESEPFMDPDERVIGLVINGEARAYPINILSSHEIVNDIVGGEPVAVTWCPLCFSAIVFSRELEGLDRPLQFGVSCLTGKPDPFGANCMEPLLTASLKEHD
jgi:hypothetical protein